MTRKSLSSHREHGGDIDKAAFSFGYDADEMLDLSTGISPIAYPAGDIPANFEQV